MAKSLSGAESIAVARPNLRHLSYSPQSRDCLTEPLFSRVRTESYFLPVRCTRPSIGETPHRETVVAIAVAVVGRVEDTGAEVEVVRVGRTRGWSRGPIDALVACEAQSIGVHVPGRNKVQWCLANLIVDIRASNAIGIHQPAKRTSTSIVTCW